MKFNTCPIGKLFKDIIKINVNTQTLVCIYINIKTQLAVRNVMFITEKLLTEADSIRAPNEFSYSGNEM